MRSFAGSCIGKIRVVAHRACGWVMRATALGVIAGLCLSAPRLQEPVQTSSLQGRVLARSSGLPLAGVEVTLQGAAGGRSSSRTTTDTSGRFQFDQVEPGRYLLRCEHNGYVQDQRPEITGGLPGEPLEIRSGQRLSDVVLLMGEAGVITGRVIDQNRTPVPLVTVSAFRLEYEERRILAPVATAISDDRGMFRMYGLRPGRYVVSTTMPSTESVDGTVSGYAPVYYPNVTDPLQASTVEIDYGTTVNLSLAATRAATFSIRGIVLDAANEARVPSAVSLFSRAVSRRQAPRSALNRRDGTFEFTNVPPGSYDVIVYVTEMGSGRVNGPPIGPGDRPPPPPPPPVPPPLDPNRLVGHVRVDVVSSDVENIVVGVYRFSLAGTVRTADGDDVPPGLQVQLRPDAFGLGIPSAAVGDDGTFEIEAIPRGEFRLVLDGLPESWYAASARLGPADVLNSPIRIDISPTAEIEMTLARSSNRLGVTVVNERGDAVAGAFVVAVPELRYRSRNDLYRTGKTDLNGRVRLDGIAPGNYELFAWESIEANAWLDAGFIATFQNQGRSVRIGPDEKVLEIELSVAR